MPTASSRSLDNSNNNNDKHKKKGDNPDNAKNADATKSKNREQVREMMALIEASAPDSQAAEAKTENPKGEPRQSEALTRFIHLINDEIKPSETTAKTGAENAAITAARAARLAARQAARLAAGSNGKPTRINN